MIKLMVVEQTQDAEIKSLQLGYNLGPVAVIAGVADVENVAGGTAVAIKMLELALFNYVDSFN
jgi:hypothetical protein